MNAATNVFVMQLLSLLENAGEFEQRHTGPNAAQQALMLKAIGMASLDALTDAIVPPSIARTQAMVLPPALPEAAALADLLAIANHNHVLTSFIGQGYYGTHTPGVVLRNILENPAWYTAYTPYQAEISQGRLEALVNFQTMVTDLTGMDIANASMLDEATAAAEAMTLALRSVKTKSQTFVVSGDAHPQTIEVIQTRAAPLGITVKLVHTAEQWDAALASDDYFAALAQYPSTGGRIDDLGAAAQVIHSKQAVLIVATDLLALTLLKAPGEFDADIVVGNTQRFGMPMCNGGPHAAFMACRDAFKRSLPGRLVGASVDKHGKPAYRLALQTREQHIRREKATSNICTAQVLPAVVASMYAVYHGPVGLKRIASRVATYTAILAKGLQQLGVQVGSQKATLSAFDTLTVHTQGQTPALLAKALDQGANLRVRAGNICISLDETTNRADIELLWRAFASEGCSIPSIEVLASNIELLIPSALSRTSTFLTHAVFNSHHSETSMLRYIRMLSDKDLALDRTMIPLGSCTMKLNATSEMIPVTWPQFANIHPFAPASQRQGYALLDEQLREWLCQATGYAAISLQPNAGSQGEYAGLLAIKAYHASKGDSQRNICLIPASAHGTNPASAQMVGMQVVVVACDEAGNVDMADLQAKCDKHSANLAATMITYPSTHGVFETQVKELCALVHAHGGRVYVDGANMNALVGVAAPGEFGGDVSHLNLHKTFCIPHGGGGPGVGPVCVVADLAPFLPSHATSGIDGVVGAVSAAPLGNAAVLPISWMYCRMMGVDALKRATQIAILGANYISHELRDHFPTLYASDSGLVAHECVLDLRHFKETIGIQAEDVAKRLIDYGFHAPTLSFPVVNTLMVEPTESESLQELDRFIAAMKAIREEIRMVETGVWPQDDNPLINAPHTAQAVSGSEWHHTYSRERAAYPMASLLQTKYWVPVARIDNVYGDRNLFCSCMPLSSYVEDKLEREVAI